MSIFINRVMENNGCGVPYNPKNHKNIETIYIREDGWTIAGISMVSIEEIEKLGYTWSAILDARTIQKEHLLCGKK